MSTSKTSQIKPTHDKAARDFMRFLNFAVFVLSAILIVWISIDTFKKIDYLDRSPYMKFQLWVCIVFIFDFFAGLVFAPKKWHYIKHRWFFLLVSIPYISIINYIGIHPGPDALYFLRFVPLARAALAMSIVVGYLSQNAVTSLCISYLTIIIFITYFCSLIFFQREAGVNTGVKDYWDALWWSAMNMTTVGCNISPVTPTGKIIAVILPICGMIMFPLFTVYLTNFVTGIFNQKTKSATPSDGQ
ncbi:MAG: potassium channel family protein [Bacteroides sp.]|nr:potassium channel family protein [Bacteroides sp.]MCM1413941.1 potassium channel family protein [Bacteroides sp.]MCM1471632.1 potassium channel family protein [Bacteroides sp.]